VRLLRSRFAMLLRRTETWVLLIALTAIIALVFASIGIVSERGGTGPTANLSKLFITFPGAYNQVLAFVLGLGGLFAVIFGASIAGSEWTFGTLKVATTRGQRRSAYLVLSFIALAALTGIGFLIVFGAGVAAAYVGATIGNIPTTGISDAAAIAALPNQLVRGWVAIGAEAAVGFAIATFARSQLAGIGVGIALYFGGNFLTLVLPNIVKWLPFNAATAVVGTAAGPSASFGFSIPQLEPDIALLVVAAWLIGSLAVSSVYVERTDITR
jgi:ABC-type transport system involved in multi-copper enzyme maturation permease subunit